jgi:hypothetical protein
MVMSVHALPAVADFFVGIAWSRSRAPGDAFADAATLGLNGWKEREDERDEVGDAHDDLLMTGAKVDSVSELREGKCWT